MCDSETGIKFDEDKLRWDLVPWGFFEEVVADLTYGAKKYAPNNWRKVDNGKARYFAAAFRHLLAYRKGEMLDEESGLSHLAMAGCNLMFLWELNSYDSSQLPVCPTCRYRQKDDDNSTCAKGFWPEGVLKCEAYVKNDQQIVTGS